MSRRLLLALVLLGCAGRQDAATSGQAPSHEETAGGELAALRASNAARRRELDAEEARLKAVQYDQAEDQRRMGELEAQLANLGLIWDEVIRDYRRAAASYETSAASYDAAKKASSEGAATYERARDEWQRAAFAWKVAAVMIAAATAIETHRLNDDVLGRVTKAEDLGCDQGMSTQSYRNKFHVASGMDVDHIVPRSLGGADHPLNYELLSAHVNRSLGNTFDAAKCTGAGAAVCAIAVAVSVKCGTYHGGIPSN